MNSQWEKIDSLAWFGFTDHGAQNLGVAVCRHNGPIGLAGDFTGL
jgi:hypothetical protein